MLEDFLKYLLFLRRETNLKKRIIPLTIISTILLSIFAIAIDKFFIWNLVGNFARCFVAILLAFSFFSMFYCIKHKRNKSKKDNHRELTFTQRLNICILSVFGMVLLHLLLIKTGSILYTMISGLMMSSWIFLFLFLYPTKDELERVSYGLYDERD